MAGVNPQESGGSSGPAATTTALRLTGGDALSLLHRISTNTLLDLPAGQTRATLFCDFRGRLLHRAVVHRAADGALWLLRDDAPGAALAAFIDRHVFRDQVAIEDRSEALPVSREDSEAPATAEAEGVPRRVFLGAEQLRIGPPLVPADPLARVASGRAAHGHEIVEEFHPFEVGLGAEVHLDKGCFTGQEVLMRLITYDSVRRRLTRVAGEGVAPEAPADLQVSGERVGRLTTAVARPGAEGWVGLAVVKSEAIEAGVIPSVGGRPLERAPEPLSSPRPQGRG